MAATDPAGIPGINVEPNQGRFLQLLARMCSARSILEIGTLGGYSTIWLGRALPPDGRLITLEYEPKHAEVARKNIANAGLDRLIEVRVGKAIETLPMLEEEGAGPFDLIFIDADKPSNPDYVAWALKVSHPGSVIVIDNVVREGSGAADVRGVRRMIDLIAAEPRVARRRFRRSGARDTTGSRSSSSTTRRGVSCPCRSRATTQGRHDQAQAGQTHESAPTGHVRLHGVARAR